MMLPTAATSDAESGAVHSVTEVQVVIRGVPAINKTDPGPGLVGKKLLPSTRRTNPFAPPA